MLKKIATYLIFSLAICLTLVAACVFFRPYAIDFFSDSESVEYTPPVVEIGLACSNDKDCIEVPVIISTIDYGFLFAIEKSIDLIREHGVLCIMSGGGDGKALLQASTLLRDNSITLCTADYLQIDGNKHFFDVEFEGRSYQGSACASACGFLVLSAEKRVHVGVAPLFGIHTPTVVLDFCFCAIPLWPDKRDGLSQMSEFIDSLPNEDQKIIVRKVYKHSLDTPSELITFLNSEDIEQFNIYNTSINYVDKN